MTMCSSDRYGGASPIYGWTGGEVGLATYFAMLEARRARWPMKAAHEDTRMVAKVRRPLR